MNDVMQEEKWIIIVVVVRGSWRESYRTGVKKQQ